MGSKRMWVIISISALLVLALGFYVYKRVLVLNYKPTAYESKIIDYFKEIALQSEIDERVNRTIKWNKPMLIYVVKDNESRQQMDYIRNSIAKINELVTDGFKIELVEDENEKNTTLYLLNREKAEEVEPNLFKGVDSTFSGLSEARYNSRMQITNASIFIDIEEPIEVQESIILEEITQSLGLMYDSNKYSNSIFYENQTTENIHNTDFSQIDREIIKLLYHPKMKAGKTAKGCDKTLKEIFYNKSS